MTMRRLFSLKAMAVAAVALAAAVGVGTASAAGAASPAGPGKYLSSCPVYATTQPFLPWADSGYYFLGPGADFEGSLTGWTVKGAKIVSGNETYYVDSPSDKQSLSLPKGATAKSPSVCVTLDTPDLRLFLKNTGSASATLSVNMTYTSNLGKASTVTVAKLSVPAKSPWTLSVPVLFLANIQSILSTNNQTWVTFQFASSGSLLIDDFYVDPIKHI